MAGVQGMMAFAAGGLPSPANKERGDFYWQDGAHEAGSTEQLFDEYIQLGDSDSEEPAAAGGRGLGHFSGASDLAALPQLSFEMLRPEGALAPSQLLAVSSSPSPRGSKRQQQLHPHFRAQANMAAFGGADAEIDGLPYGGSISDSELLKLEGQTMRSPRIQLPQLSASEPASPPSKPVSPRKAGRLETFCTKIRNKASTLGKTKQVEVKPDPDAFAEPVMSTAQMAPARGRPRPQNLHISKAQLASPPLTSGMPGQRPAAGSGSDASFVNGMLDDPFMADSLLSGQFVPPLQLNGTTIPQTPLQTPLLDGWQLPMATPNGKPLWAAAGPYFQGVDADAGWWHPDAMDTDMPLYHARNASVNLLTLQHQQSFEYPAPPGTEDAAAHFPAANGLLHMPQPRGIPPAVLHAGARPTRADHHHRRPNPRAPSSGARHRQYPGAGPGLSPRKPRTASAARIGSVSPGPKRAALPPSGSGSAGNARLHRCSASLQTLSHPAAATASAADTPAGAAVRKRRSWASASARRTSSSSLHHQYLNAATTPRRTTHPGSSSSNTHPNNQSHHPPSGHHPSHTPRTTTNHTNHTNPNHPNPKHPASTSHPHPHHDPEEDPMEPDADGFVNYTPSDSLLLMTSVAPSGSSKTKARREREAAEQQLAAQEALGQRFARLVAEAGGDVRKLGGLEFVNGGVNGVGVGTGDGNGVGVGRS